MPNPPLVCVLAYNGMHLFEMGIASEIFGLPRPEFNAWYDFKIVSSEPKSLNVLGGITIQASYDLTLLEKASLIIIPGWKAEGMPIPTPVKDALCKGFRNGARLASICSGVFLLAQCGFLTGKKATTHWKHSQKLSNLYPDVNVDEDVLYIDEGQILTSAGSAAGVDLCLHIVRQDFGSDIANQVARRLILPAYREGGQAQYISRPMPKERGGKIAPLLDKIRSNLNIEWTNEKMAQIAGLTPRTLLRRFKDTIGESPQNWLIGERIERTKELLETTSLSISELAETTGFVTPETLRHHFRRKVGTNPTQYKNGFNRI